MGKRKTEDLLTDTQKQPTITVSTEMNSAHPFQAQHYYPGDSVNEHKKLGGGQPVNKPGGNRPAKGK